MFYRFRPKTPVRFGQFRARLTVELLEPRNLLSASSVTAVTTPPVPGGAAPTSPIVAAPTVPTVSPSTDNPQMAQPLASIVRADLPGLAPYTPAQIAKAYGFDQITFNNGAVTGNGAGQTIAIVDATYDPNIASDLHTFDQQFGLSDPTLVTHTMAPPSKMKQEPYGWGVEMSLDVEWAHAMAPAASILLVEAQTQGKTNMLSAISYAANYQGNTNLNVAPTSVVSMSFGYPEWSTETRFDTYFTTPDGHSNVAFVAASGDNGSGYAPLWPSVSANVLGVGGTTLNLNTDNSYKSESGWSGSGGGFSQYVSQPSYQSSDGQSTTKRTTPDVSYNADPNTGFWVYEKAVGGWVQVGGTSAGSPQWAALTAIADQGRALAGKNPLANVQADVYALPSGDFHDVTSGSNGGFTAGSGYDLVTGLGSPIANKVAADLVNSSDSSFTGGGPLIAKGPNGGGNATPLVEAHAPGSANTPATLAGTTDSGAGGLPDSRAGATSHFSVEATPTAPAAQTTSQTTGEFVFADPTIVSSATTPATPTTNTADQAFAGLSTQDWQMMTESAWGYHPTDSASATPMTGGESDSVALDGSADASPAAGES